MRLALLLFTGSTALATAGLVGALHRAVPLDPVLTVPTTRSSGAHLPPEFWRQPPPEAPLPSLGRMPTPVARVAVTPLAPLDPRAADFLFVVDDSGSTRDDDLLHKVGDPIDAFLARLNDARIDWRVAITTTDMFAADRRGKLIGAGRWKVLSPSTSGAAGNFRINLAEALEKMGSGHERGLAAAGAAIDGVRAEDRTDFLRPEAKLHLVFISDEEDGSLGTLDDFRTAWLAVKGGDEARLSISAVYGPMSCRFKKDEPLLDRRGNRLPPDVEAYFRELFAKQPAAGESRYEKLALESSGIVGDLCAKDFTDPLLMLAESVTAPLVFAR